MQKNTVLHRTHGACSLMFPDRECFRVPENAACVPSATVSRKIEENIWNSEGF